MMDPINIFFLFVFKLFYFPNKLLFNAIYFLDHRFFYLLMLLIDFMNLTSVFFLDFLDFCRILILQFMYPNFFQFCIYFIVKFLLECLSYFIDNLPSLAYDDLNFFLNSHEYLVGMGRRYVNAGIGLSAKRRVFAFELR